MEKVIWGKTMVFKEKLTMLDRQKVMQAKKKMEETEDAMELAFALFPILCVTIDWKELSNEEKSDYIKNIDEMEDFADISWVIAEIQTKIAEWYQKKK